jgi:hypothetical protein
METTQIGGFASYVELLTCLEMARDDASPNTDSNDRDAKSVSRPRRISVTVHKTSGELSALLP